MTEYLGQQPGRPNKKGPQGCDPKLITVHVAPSTTTNPLGQIRHRCITQKGD